MKSYQIPILLKQLITSNQAFHYRIVPIKKEGTSVTFITDKSTQSLKKELKVVLNFDIILKQEETSILESYLTINYRKPIKGNSQFLDKTNFLDQILHTAKDFNSSDIHIEIYNKQARARFRIDGKLKTQFHISQQEYPQLINQIKIKANLDIAQKRLSQDGRITVATSEEEFDIRVSTMPTLYGEKVVLRILKREAESVNLKQLGFNQQELNIYLEGIRNPNGIILISGPTGSGKTTTLYGTIKYLNNEELNILTIEDPIEYTLDGINQVQLKEDIGFNFPTALRTFLRQDPNIIMVGEIRDEKTANMAIKAALTGHLVLSTIHTNSAWGSISRLIDMGVAPYLLATTITMSVAQRLVRKLCVYCKKEDIPNKHLFPPSFKNFKDIKRHFIAVGCNKCYYTGYQGRKAIFEIIPISKELEILIKQNQLNIDAYLAKHNIRTLKQNAINLINNGETSIDEVYSLLAK
jgi:type IV pilus assembly protein PilB